VPVTGDEGAELPASDGAAAAADVDRLVGGGPERADPVTGAALVTVSPD
jgi:hypothetical protein